MLSKMDRKLRRQENDKKMVPGVGSLTPKFEVGHPLDQPTMADFRVSPCRRDPLSCALSESPRGSKMILP